MDCDNPLGVSKIHVQSSQGEREVNISVKELETHFIISVIPSSRDEKPSCSSADSVAAAPEPVATRARAEPKRSEENKGVYTCEICGRDFARKPYLTLHMRMHTGERPFCCKVCLKRFSHRSGLNRHVRMHDQIRPYACKYCGRRFIQSSSRNSHEKAHEYAGTAKTPEDEHAPEPIEKPHKCPDCDKGFSTVTQLKCHVRTHTGEKPYECQYCGKKSTAASAHVIHERKHTGERPYECSFCDKRFISSTAKKTHEITHSSEKRYHCEICDKYFARPSSRAAHVTAFHGRGPNKPSKKKLSENVTPATEEKKFQCSDCGRKFALGQSLKIHIEMTHAAD